LTHLSQQQTSVFLQLQMLAVFITNMTIQLVIVLEFTLFPGPAVGNTGQNENVGFFPAVK
jgi:hypothetical protein